VPYWSVFLFLSAAAGSAVSGPPSTEAVAHLERDGRSLFIACDFKRATRVFERALSAQPNNATLYYWLGKSYARQAEMLGPLFVPKPWLRKTADSRKEHSGPGGGCGGGSCGRRAPLDTSSLERLP
jgi:hypothetical protein